MRPGQILVADHNGVYVIKMVGDVRLTLCMSFDQFIDNMFADKAFCEVLFDLSEAEAIDSTTLGLMAKISILGEERVGARPLIFSPNESINRILDTMGFADIFIIVNELEKPIGVTQALASAGEQAVDEAQVKTKVIEAHKMLMCLNKDNEKIFTDLVNMLEAEQ
ncbi:STAS domain-containing protein [Gilvimarinus sp. SDUM040013]|uniref:STAS domain-containing protein n=1 Tax=Gilvimarinus gilvus TaxID=3058038 RepID=A0ABU4RTC5_9GAMM|nr:STAS domain-containing protein [Gilvimarinus sp. SDUM040013]MDO3386964.1 STAS domain-containing protein [Gilvimarinus sp. SDUM040013]MDX6848142.1 STAS domain-containing protein [Gilvimarinus sp. SDUM040013]